MGYCPAGRHFLEDIDILVRDFAAGAEIRRLKGFEFLFHPPATDTQDDTPVRKHVIGRQHSAQHDRVSVRHHKNGGADLHLLRRPRQHAHRRDRL